MITAVQDKDVYIIHFPYDAEIVRLVKHVPGSWYVPEHKYWTIPVNRLGFFILQLQGTPYENQLKVYSAEHIDENATLDATDEIPDIDLSGIPLYVQDGQHLFNHQLDFMRYAIDRQRNHLTSGFILADSMGLGKTLELMNLALYNRKFNGIKHCLIIVCVNSAKYNWISDIKKHTNGEEIPYLLGTRKKRDGTLHLDGSSLEKLEDLKCGHMYGDKNEPPLPFFLIMNIEAIRMISSRRYPIRERLTTLLNKGYIGMVALDEVHKNCLVSDTLITTDMGLLKIGDVVRNKMDINVLSYNESTNHVEWCPVIDWIENVSNTPLLELHIETPTGVKRIRCTPNHKFYTKNRGWVCAKDLCDTDDIVMYRNRWQ